MNSKPQKLQKYTKKEQALQELEKNVFEENQKLFGKGKVIPILKLLFCASICRRSNATRG